MMERNTETRTFRSELRKANTIYRQLTHPLAGQQNGEADEHTSLLGRASTTYTNGASGHSATRDFFLNSKYTPGTESPKPWVKYPAHVWHVTKATLLSSE
jgi:Ca2+:H+ antiporter